MNILIVEDDEHKATSISDYIAIIVDKPVITTATCVSEAIDFVSNSTYDLILVDMSIPSHPVTSGGGSPISFLTGGLEIILELRSNNRQDPCIIITQYPDIEICGQFYAVKESASEIQKQLDCTVFECIEYSQSSDDWKDNLKNTIGRVKFL